MPAPTASQGGEHLLGIARHFHFHLCAMLWRTHPRLEPSPYRVLALLLLKLPAIVAALGTRALPGVLRTFLAALWPEGSNPNPGRPYCSNLYAFEIAWTP
jgi:hypothetical protein